MDCRDWGAGPPGVAPRRGYARGDLGPWVETHGYLQGRRSAAKAHVAARTFAAERHGERSRAF
jgi:hypothetical protein